MRRSLLLLLLLSPAAALAQRDALENPGAYEVVQEREYSLRHELSLGGGILPLDAFYKGVVVQLAYTHHFNDHFGWQVGRGLYSYDVDTGLRTQLERDFGVLTTAVREVQWMAGSDLVWSPFYGKTAFMNRVLLHFQLFLELGATVIKTQEAFSPAVHFGGGLRWFASEWLSLKLNITNEFAIGKRPFNVPEFELAFAFNFGSED